MYVLLVINATLTVYGEFVLAGQMVHAAAKTAPQPNARLFFTMAALGKTVPFPQTVKIRFVQPMKVVAQLYQELIVKMATVPMQRHQIYQINCPMVYNPLQ